MPKLKPTKITFALNASLCQQAENFLESQRTQFNFTYSSLSELIRKSLQAYQEGVIEPNLTQRDKHAPKKEVSIRFFNTDLLNFYYSLPYTQRTALIEQSLREFLDKISQKSKELQKYRRIIQFKKPQPQLSPYHLSNFICDNCGDELYNTVAYSYASNLSQAKKGYHTYCSNCVR